MPAAIRAQTQPNAPAPLGPPVRLVPTPGPVTAPTSTPAAPTPAAGDVQVLPPGVQATPLAPVDAAWAGTLSAADGAFPETMWQGTPRSFVAAALPLLQPTTSPVLQELARRLLMSNAMAPGGEDPPQGPGLAPARIGRLVALGQIDGAVAVLDRIAWRGNPEALDRLRVDLAFIKNDNDGACRRVEQAGARYQDIWWDRAQIACQALSGDQAKASLGQSVLRERKAPRDQLFDNLIDAVGGRQVKIDRMPDPTPVRVALLAAAKLPLPPDAFQSADAGVLRAWSTNTNIPNDRRLAAAERAAALGAIDPDALRLLYTEITFKPEERKAALTQAGENPRARALLYASAKQETVPAARAEAVQALLDAGAKRGEFAFWARLTAPLILELRQSPDLDWFAPSATRALYASGQLAEARRWLQIVNPELQKQLFVVARLAEGNSVQPWPREGLRAVLEALMPKEGSSDLAKPMLALALLSAVGEPVNAGDWLLLIGVPPAPGGSAVNPAIWLAGRDAALNRRIGESVLETLLLARAGDKVTVEPIAIAESISRLRAIGLEGEARRLALEAALTAGL